MTPSEPNGIGTIRRTMRLSVGLLCLLAAALLAVLLIQRPNDTVTFRVVDAKTGQPISNLNAYIYARWTMLPVEQLGLSPGKSMVLTGENGTYLVHGIPRSKSVMRVIFTHGDYHAATFTVADEGYKLYDPRPGRVLERTNFVTIALKGRP